MFAPRRFNDFSQAYVRTLTAFAVLLGPSLASRAQDASEPIGDELRRVVQTPQSVASIRLAPRAVLTAPEARLLPIEAATAAGLEYVGVDPVEVELIEVVIEPPLGTRLFYAAAVRFASPFDLEDLDPRVWQHCDGDADGADGVRYVSRDPDGPSFEMADERTLLVASAGMMRKLADADRPAADGPFAAWLDGLDRSHHVHAAVNFEALRPFAQMAIAASGDEVPEELRPYLGPIVEDLRFIEAGIGIGSAPPWRLAIEAADADGADRLAGVLGGWRDNLVAQAREKAEEALASDDPVEQAMGRWSMRISPLTADALLPRRDGARFFYETPTDLDDPTAVMLAQTTTIGVLVALLLPAVQAAREAARRNQSMNQLKQVLLALLNYESATGEFPPQAITGPNGEPLLSWRVAVLPYLEETELYEEFRLDEPWDSPHNRALIPRMPALLLDPSSPGLDELDGKTHYLGVAGRNTLLGGGERGETLFRITDGTSNTLAVVQVDDANAVTWTRPVDYDAAAHRADPMAGIGVLHPGAFLGGFCDGHVQSIAVDTDRNTLRALMTINGGEPVELP